MQDERDRAIDHALRKSRGAWMSASERPAGDHVGAEMLAAWADGSLRPDEAATVETHLSMCAQCQELVAAFARTSPPPLVREPLWRRWRLQWLVPIATAATAIAIWIAAPRPQSQVAEGPVLDRTGSATLAVQPPTANPIEPPVHTPEADQLARAPEPKARPLEKKESRRDTQDQPATRAEAKSQLASADKPAEPAKQDAAAPSAALAERIQLAPAASPAAPPAAATAPAPAGATTAAETPSTMARALRDSNVAGAQSSRQFATVAEIVSPNRSSRWRIIGARQVEHSDDGGNRWQAATLPAGITATAGISPAASVCWIVGRGGAVLVTSDGLRFTRLMFPEPIDLISVAATDDRHATVMSADGRTFRTDDQGVTWTR